MSPKDIRRRFQRLCPYKFLDLEHRRFLTLLVEQDGKFAPAAFFCGALEDEFDWDTDKLTIIYEHDHPLWPELRQIKSIRLVRTKWKHYWVYVVMHVYPKRDADKIWVFTPIMMLCDTMMSTKIVNENRSKQ